MSSFTSRIHNEEKSIDDCLQNDYNDISTNIKIQNRIVFRRLRSAHNIIPYRREIKVKIFAGKYHFEIATFGLKNYIIMSNILNNNNIHL